MKYILRFRRENKDIFEAIRKGKKKIETRAATAKFQRIKKGDTIELVCGKERFKKRVKDVFRFKNIKTLLKEFKVQDIAPGLTTEKELRKLYYSFSGYKEKIKKYGLIAFELV